MEIEKKSATQLQIWISCNYFEPSSLAQNNSLVRAALLTLLMMTGEPMPSKRLVKS